MQLALVAMSAVWGLAFVLTQDALATLPFLSFGGSSLLVNSAAAGILLNISRQGAPREIAEAEVETPPAPEVEDTVIADALGGAQGAAE